MYIIICIHRIHEQKVHFLPYHAVFFVMSYLQVGILLGGISYILRTLCTEMFMSSVILANQFDPIWQMLWVLFMKNISMHLE